MYFFRYYEVVKILHKTCFADFSCFQLINELIKNHKYIFKNKIYKSQV